MKKKTACRRGHLYTPTTLYVRPNGRRTCRVCKSMMQREAYARSKLKAVRTDPCSDREPS